MNPDEREMYVSGTVFLDENIRFKKVEMKKKLVFLISPRFFSNL